MDIYRPEETGAWVFGLDEPGTIVSVSDKAVNIRVADRRLVSIVRHGSAMTAMSVLCPRLLDSSEVIQSGPGQRITLAEGIIAADGWHMDTRGTERFEGHPAVDTPFEMDTHKLDRFEKILHFAGQKEGLLGIARHGRPGNSFVRRGRKIVEKIMSHNRKHIARHLAEFSGLGPGFTPAGDDLIGGFLMGETLARRENRLFSDRSALAPVLKASDGTCDAGRTLIWMALEGRFPRFLCRAVVELRHAETAKDLLAMVTNATRYGHSSGTDALTGLHLYHKISQRHLDNNRQRTNAPSDVHPRQTSISG
jgi:hypothetical protein